MEQTYRLAPRLLHWLIAAIVIPLILVGLVLHFDVAPKPMRHLLAWLHISFGLTVLVLMLARLALRLQHEPPALPAEILMIERRAAWVSHRLFYLLLFAMPVFGIVFEEARQRAINWFGLVTLPQFLALDKPLGHVFAGLHFWGGMALIALLVAHIGAVVHHHRQGIPILRRIWR
jgi:cytochrome b561